MGERMRGVLRLSTGIALGVGVAACTQADGSKAVGMAGSPLWMATASPEAKLATYRASCEGYGYVAGTPEMARCMQEEAADYRDLSAASVAAMGASMQRTGQEMQRVGGSTTTTSCSSLGNSIDCTSRSY